VKLWDSADTFQIHTDCLLAHQKIWVLTKSKLRCKLYAEVFVSWFQMGYDMGLGGSWPAEYYQAYSKIILTGIFGSVMLFLLWYYGGLCNYLGGLGRKMLA
jgi:hypothetical protein